MNFKHFLIVAAAMGAFTATSAQAQSYYARERLTTGTTTVVTPPVTTPTPTPSPTPTPAPTQPATVSCTPAQYGKWAANYSSRTFVSLGMSTSVASATTLCKNYVQSTGKVGICAVNATVFFYEGSTATENSFAPNYTMVCTAS